MLLSSFTKMIVLLDQLAWLSQFVHWSKLRVKCNRLLSSYRRKYICHENQYGKVVLFNCFIRYKYHCFIWHVNLILYYSKWTYVSFNGMGCAPTPYCEESLGQVCSYAHALFYLFANRQRKLVALSVFLFHWQVGL